MIYNTRVCELHVFPVHFDARAALSAPLCSCVRTASIKNYFHRIIYIFFLSLSPLMCFYIIIIFFFLLSGLVTRAENKKKKKKPPANEFRLDRAINFTVLFILSPGFR